MAADLYIEETRLVKKCRVKGCESGAYSRGLCPSHYRQDQAGALTEPVEAPAPEEGRPGANAPEGGQTVRRKVVKAEEAQAVLEGEREKARGRKGRPSGSSNFDDDFVFRVREAWLSGEWGTDAEVGKRFGIRGVVVGMFRKAKRPDGQDWMALKARRLGVRAPLRVELIPAQSADALTLNRIAAGMGMRMTAIYLGLTGGRTVWTRPATQPLGREAISEVYDDDDQPIPVGSLMPMTYRDVLRSGEIGVKVLRDCVDTMAAMQESQAEMDRVTTKHVLALARHLRLTPEQLEELAELERTGAIPVVDAPAPAGVVVEGEFEPEDDETETDDEESGDDGDD